jgi:hypothetical protein
MYFHYGMTKYVRYIFILHCTISTQALFYFVLFISVTNWCSFWRQWWRTVVNMSGLKLLNSMFCKKWSKLFRRRYHALLFFINFGLSSRVQIYVRFFVTLNIFSGNVCIEVVQCIIGNHTNPHEYFDLKTLESYAWHHW